MPLALFVLSIQDPKEPRRTASTRGGKSVLEYETVPLSLFSGADWVGRSAKIGVWEGEVTTTFV